MRTWITWTPRLCSGQAAASLALAIAMTATAGAAPTPKGKGRIFSAANASFAQLHPFRQALWNGDVTTTTVADMDRTARTMAAEYARTLKEGDKKRAGQLRGGVESLALYRLLAGQRLGLSPEQAAADLCAAWKQAPEIQQAAPKTNPEGKGSILRSVERWVSDEQWLNQELATFGEAKPEAVRLGYLKSLSPATALVARAYENGLESVSEKEILDQLAKKNGKGPDSATLLALLTAKTGSTQAAEDKAAALGQEKKKALDETLARQGASLRSQGILNRLGKPDSAAEVAAKSEAARKAIAEGRLPIAD